MTSFHKAVRNKYPKKVQQQHSSVAHAGPRDTTTSSTIKSLGQPPASSHTCTTTISSRRGEGSGDGGRSTAARHVGHVGDTRNQLRRHASWYGWLHPQLARRRGPAASSMGSMQMRHSVVIYLRAPDLRAPERRLGLLRAPERRLGLLRAPDRLGLLRAPPASQSAGTNAFLVPRFTCVREPN